MHSYASVCMSVKSVHLRCSLPIVSCSAVTVHPHADCVAGALRFVIRVFCCAVECYLGPRSAPWLHPQVFLEISLG